jgi:hypothetical protein
MAVTSRVTAQLELTNDVALDSIFQWSTNAASPGQTYMVNLISGNNTITVPTGGSSVLAGVVIVPPAGNAVVLTLKGVNGDTGITLGLTNPSVVSLGIAVASFVVNAAGAVTGMRFFFF